MKQYSKAIAAAIAGLAVSLLASQGIDMDEGMLTEILIPLVGAGLTALAVYASPANKESK